MTDEPAVDVSGLFDYGARVERKRARQRALAQALTASPGAEPIDEELARRVDTVIERLDELAGQTTEPVDVLTGATAAQAQQRSAFLDALRGRQPQRRREGEPAQGFGGGARHTVPPVPETHESWLAAALGDRRADVGANL